ncbi:MAG: hypothetical protein Q7S57_02010 [bacterium]|nr:hypothetical protein [bacterium]
MNRLQEVLALTDMIVRILPRLVAEVRKQNIKTLLDMVDLGSFTSRSQLESVLDEVLRNKCATRSYTDSESEIRLFAGFLGRLKKAWEQEIVVTFTESGNRLYVTYALPPEKKRATVPSQLIVAHGDGASMTGLTDHDLLRDIDIAIQAGQTPAEQVLSLAKLGHAASEPG